MKKGDILDLEITDLAFGGRGIATLLIDEKRFVVFVDGGLPGQKVSAKITKKKRRYAEAKIEAIQQPSPKEIEIPYQRVAGAPWASLPILEQQAYKKKQVFDLFLKLAKQDIKPIFDEYIESPDTWNYRNKMEFSFGPTKETFVLGADDEKIWSHTGFGLGSKKRGQFWLVEDLETPSGLFNEKFESFLPLIKKWAEETELKPYNTRTNEGFFRHLVVRKSTQTKGFLINLVTSVDQDKSLIISEFVDLCRKALGDLVSGIFWTESDDLGNPMTKYERRRHCFGSKKLPESLTIKDKKLFFEISLDSFFQTNPRSAEKLYEKTLDYVDPQDGEKIFDCLCGTGTIAQIMAKSASSAKIYGIEIVASAIADAIASAKKNEVADIKFFNEDIGKFLTAHPYFKNEITTVVLDPPRAGISPKSLQKVIDLGAKKIVYVSCNASTMARDTELLEKSNYQLQKISLVDQFPHTSHVEVVGLFNRLSFK